MKTLYIPQGYAARFITATKDYGIDSLYTDNFSNCNIVACINKNKMFLAHVDIMRAGIVSDIIDEIKWVGENAKIIVIHRPLSFITSELVKDLKISLPNSTIEQKNLEITHNGIELFLDKQPNTSFHSNIKIWPTNEKPETLIHHPQEQIMLTVKKVEQIIGMQALLSTEKIKPKQFFLFDGRAWEPLGENELELNTSHPETKKEMKSFEGDYSFLIIKNKLKEIIKSVKTIKIKDDIEEFASRVAFYFEGHLNNYNIEKPFKRNILEALDRYAPKTLEDKRLIEETRNICITSENAFKDLEKLFSEYEKKASLSDFKKNILSEYKSYSTHYKKREEYSHNEEIRSQLLSSAKLSKEEGNKKHGEKLYKEAASFFNSALKNYTYCCLKSDPLLSAIYNNLGDCLYRSRQYNEAKFFLETSVLLKENYTDPKPQATALKGSLKLLDLCNQKISSLSSSSSRSR